MILSRLNSIYLFSFVLIFFFYEGLFSQNIKFVKKETTSFQKAINYIHKGQKLGLEKKFDSANYYIDKGTYIAEINNNIELKAYANLYSSEMAYWEGEIKIAKDILIKNQKILLSDSIQIRANLLFSEICWYEKNNIDALKYLIKAEKQLFDLPFLTKRDSSLVRKGYYNTAIIHEELENIEKARYYFTKGLNFVSDSNDRSYFLFRNSLKKL